METSVTDEEPMTVSMCARCREAARIYHSAVGIDGRVFVDNPVYPEAVPIDVMMDRLNMLVSTEQTLPLKG